MRIDPGVAAPEAGSVRDETRARIIAVAAHLLAEQGRDALTTRAVATAAGVQPPTIYRFFGDKSGLVEAVAEHGFATYLADKEMPLPDADPVEDLRAGWDLHVGFGLANPAIYALMNSEPQSRPSPSAVAGEQFLKARIRRLAAAGRLRVDEDMASVLMQASGRGIVLTLLSMPSERREQRLLDAAREAVFAAIVTDAPVGTGASAPASAAIALRAVLPDATVLTGGERHLLDELLERLSRS
jgi:AcrR family transcriptional regulator